MIEHFIGQVIGMLIGFGGTFFILTKISEHIKNKERKERIKNEMD